MAPPTGQVPPPLPPSVEEAYRRKCIQLKQRLNEVEEANDASRLRLDRMKRGIDKLRLERAFLLEQLAKRTSTNVEDSEGSPSPPPTPKEKPLRTKRGHRKPSFLTNLNDARNTSLFQSTQALTLSPSNSDAFSHTAAVAAPPVRTFSTAPNAMNGSVAPPPRKPRNAFELFVNDNRSVITVAKRQEIKKGAFDVDRELASLWHGLGPSGQEPFQKRFRGGDLGNHEGAFEEEDKDETKDEDTKDEDTEMGEHGEDVNDAEDIVGNQTM